MRLVWRVITFRDWSRSMFLPIDPGVLDTMLTFIAGPLSTTFLRQLHKLSLVQSINVDP